MFKLKKEFKKTSNILIKNKKEPMYTKGIKIIFIWF